MNRNLQVIYHAKVEKKHEWYNLSYKGSILDVGLLWLICMCRLSQEINSERPRVLNHYILLTKQLPNYRDPLEQVVHSHTTRSVEVTSPSFHHLHKISQAAAHDQCVSGSSSNSVSRQVNFFTVQWYRLCATLHTSKNPTSRQIRHIVEGKQMHCTHTHSVVLTVCLLY